MRSPRIAPELGLRLVGRSASPAHFHLRGKKVGPECWLTAKQTGSRSCGSDCLRSFKLLPARSEVAEECLVPAVLAPRSRGGKSKLTGSSDAVTGQESWVWQEGGSAGVFEAECSKMHFIYNETPTICLLLNKK